MFNSARCGYPLAEREDYGRYRLSLRDGVRHRPEHISDPLAQNALLMEHHVSIEAPEIENLRDRQGGYTGEDRLHDYGSLGRDASVPFRCINLA